MLGQLAAPKNLCVLRLSAISDVCYAMAAVQNIQKQWPHTQITWVCGKVEADLLKGINKIEVIALDYSNGLKGYLDFREHMQGQHFDILLNMEASIKANLASFYISANTKVGFDSKRAKKGQWLFTNARIKPLAQAHLLDDFMGFAETLGLKIDVPNWQMPKLEHETLWVEKTLLSDNQKPIAVINLSNKKTENNWHIDGYVKTAEYLDHKGFSVVICAENNESEIQLATNICQQSKVTINNLTAKATLKQLLAILKLSHITIGPDSALTHMSVAAGTPVVGLYSQYNPRRIGPYLYQKYVVSCYAETILKQTGKKEGQLPWGFTAKKPNLEALTFDLVKTQIDNLINDYYPEITQ